MKILMLHPHDIFDHHEPWTIRIESIAREFVRKGHEVKLVNFINEISVERLTRHAYGFDIISLKRRHRYRVFKENFHVILEHIKWADIVHFQKCFHYVSLPVLIGSCIYRKPVHYDWDDFEEAIYVASAHPPNWMVRLFLRAYEHTLPRVVNTVSVASQALKDMCVSFGVAEENIYDAPVGADLRKFGSHISGEKIRKRFGKKEKVVLYLGQLNGAQYTTLFVEAVSQLRKVATNTQFVIVGSGTKFNSLKQYARKLEVSDIITFIGAVRHELVPQYLAAADIAVACFEDNQITRCKSPLKVVEYLAAGKPIVASAVGEVKTMLNGCGILVRPGSSQALAEGIQQALANDNQREQLGVLARTRAEEKYNWPAIAQDLLNAYGRSLGNGQEPDVVLSQAPQKETE